MTQHRPINAPAQSKRMNYILWGSPVVFLGQHLSISIRFQSLLFPLKGGATVPVDRYGEYVYLLTCKPRSELPRGTQSRFLEDH